MKVKIPTTAQHDGSPFCLAEYEISDNCPICGEKRGDIFPALSYDGSRRLNVDGWKNPCGHIDKYSDVRKEAKNLEIEFSSSE